MATYTRELEKFSVGQANGDSPVFGGMYEFCRRYTGEWKKKNNFLLNFFFQAAVFLQHVTWIKAYPM